MWCWTPSLSPPSSTQPRRRCTSCFISFCQEHRCQHRLPSPLRRILMSFGFSVGDFIAVGKLIIQISSALSESTGASAEYQSLLLRLDSLTETLRIAEISVRGHQLPLCTTNAILKHLGQCSAHLRKFSAIIEKHRKSLSKGGSGNRIADSWRKIGWSVFTREEIKEINGALEEDVNFISMMLTMCGT